MGRHGPLIDRAGCVCEGRRSGALRPLPRFKSTPAPRKPEQNLPWSELKAEHKSRSAQTIHGGEGGSIPFVQRGERWRPHRAGNLSVLFFLKKIRRAISHSALADHVALERWLFHKSSLRFLSFGSGPFFLKKDPFVVFAAC